jgi:LysR family transcriptional regulator, low CO2-responsive transcriptional regulator
MYLEQLRFFHAVAESGSFTAAAKELHLTQPAVSSQLKNLEDELGQRMFERVGRSVRLTRAGEVLHTHTRRIFQQVREAEVILEDLKSLQTGRLYLGTVDVMSIYVLPSIFRVFHSRFPRVEISIEVDDTTNISRGVLERRYDLGFATLPLREQNLMSIPVYNDVMRAIAPAGHPLAGKKLVTLQELANTTMIVYKQGSVTRSIIEQIFRSQGIELEPDMEIDRPEAMKKLVEAGLGVSIMPEMSIEREVEEGSLVVLPTGDISFERQLGLIYRPWQVFSPSVVAFLSILREKLKPTVWISEFDTLNESR